MPRVTITLAIILAGCGLGKSTQAIEIENFKSGLVCPQKSPKNIKSSDGEICFETDTIHITGQSTCTYNGSRQRCTWYGFEFDYKNASSKQVIKCKVTSSDLATY